MRVFGKVKSFDRATGVGCAVSDGGAQAAFTAAVLKPFGLSQIDEGVALTFELALGNGGLCVTTIYDIAGHGVPAGVEGAKPVTRVRGTVQWYDHVKGFGFVVSKDIDADVLLHRSIVTAFGIETLLPGAVLDCDVVQKLNGWKVVRLHAVLPPERPIDEALLLRPPFPPPSPVSGGSIVLDPGMLTRLTRFQVRPHTGGQTVVRGAKGFGFVLPSDEPWEYAVCKWFSRPKGYGFVRLEDGDEDIFVHMDTLRQCGMRTLSLGQRVRVRVERADKGLVVTEIEPDEDDDA
jgi:cold shock protein